jgi:hypothetical protein
MGGEPTGAGGEFIRFDTNRPGAIAHHPVVFFAEIDQPPLEAGDEVRGGSKTGLPGQEGMAHPQRNALGGLL